MGFDLHFLGFTPLHGWNSETANDEQSSTEWGALDLNLKQMILPYKTTKKALIYIMSVGIHYVEFIKCSDLPVPMFPPVFMHRSYIARQPLHLCFCFIVLYSLISNLKCNLNIISN